MTLKQLYNFLIDLVFPNRCGFCFNVIPWNKLICDECERSLEYSDRSAVKDVNGAFELCVYPCDYFGTAKNGVLNLKYHYGHNTAEYLLPHLINLIKEKLPYSEIDIIASVPMTRKRRAQSGYNHAEVIAKLLSEELDIPYDGKLLSKSNKTVIQHEQSASDRRTLVKGMYNKGVSDFDLNNKTILLADDIITTGSTLSECASVLKSMGAARVYCCTLAGSLYTDERSENSVQS